MTTDLENTECITGLTEFLTNRTQGKMGFGADRTFRKSYRNRPETATIGGKTCHFRSQLEIKAANYLELLKTGGHIKDWAYEQTRFEFPDDKWLIDFDVLENDGNFYYVECKGHFEARDRRKLKLLFKYKPEVKILYIFENNSDRNKIKTASKYLWWRKPVLLRELTKGIL